MMYFANRMQAGRMLAKQIAKKYQDQDCAVVALSDGGVMVGAQISLQLKCVITLLLSDVIELPRELVAIGGITHDGTFSYNHSYSTGELDEMLMEYHGVIEQEKLVKLHNMHTMMGAGSLIKPELLKHKNVILVSDGLTTAFAVDLAMAYLRPIAMKKLIIATPLSSVPAIDRLHVIADDIFCLNVLENYITTDHYYDAKDIPEHQVIVDTIEHIVNEWKEPT